MSTSSPGSTNSAFRGRVLAVVVIAVWTASLPLAEGVFRLIGDRTTTNLSGLYQPFADRGYRLREDASGTADTLQGRYAIATNAFGLRCSGSQKGQSPRTPVHILALGDSQAFGAGLNFEDSVVGQLAAKAAERGLSIENGAIGGHFLANQLELADWLYVKGLRAQRILLFLSPYLIATAGEYNRVSVGEDGNLYTPERQRPLVKWLKRNTVTYARLRNAINRVHPLGEDELTPLAVKIYLKERESKYREQVMRALTEWKRWTDARNISLVIAYTPLAVEVAFDPVRERAHQAGAGAVAVDGPFSAAQSAAEALGIALIDLRPTLQQLAAERRALTLPADPHYDAQTSAACAGRLWAALSEGSDISASTSSAALMLR